MSATTIPRSLALLKEIQIQIWEIVTLASDPVADPLYARDAFPRLSWFQTWTPGAMVSSKDI